MRAHPSRLASLAASAALAALLAGCGDSRSLVEPPPPVASGHDLPAHALGSIQGLVQWARTLAPSEDAEPLRLAGVVLPSSDSAEPLALP